MKVTTDDFKDYASLDNYLDMVETIGKNCVCIKCDGICNYELIKAIVTIGNMKNGRFENLYLKHKREKE